MKNRMFKILSLGLVVISSTSNTIPVFAYDVDENDNSIESVEYQNDKDKDFNNNTSVFAQLGSEYKVTIPKVVVLSGASKAAKYIVKVDGDIAGYETVNVVPDNSFSLNAKNKDTQEALINQDKTSWTYSTLGSNAKGSITANGITAGSWQGKFNFNINLDKTVGDAISPDHEHTWSKAEITQPTCTQDGLKTYTCACGETKSETIPMLGHTYVEGKCTVCGDTLPDLDVQAEGYTGTFDSASHSARIVSEGNDITYSIDGENFVLENPSFTDAGIYTVYYKVSKEKYKTVTGSVNIVINKAQPILTKAPAVKELTYNKGNQNLLEEGIVENGTIYYRLENGEYTTSVPVAKNAGTYNISYKIVGDKNYEDIEETSGLVAIKKAESPVSLGTSSGAVTQNASITTTILGNEENAVLSVSSSNESVATAAIENGNLKVTGKGTGSCIITINVAENSNYTAKTISYPVVVSSTLLSIDANGGTYKGSTDIATFGVEEGKSFTKSFSYNGGTQELTIPYTGFYFVEAWGGKGGDDAAVGGKGGYLKGYAFLNEGQTIYITCGNVGVSKQGSAAGGFNGGGSAGSVGSSGGGGGATSITTTNRGVLGNFANYKDEVLMVAGGGSGGAIRTAGEGGTVLYTYTEDNNTYPGKLITGSTEKLNGNFYQGNNCGTGNDGGGGGGGWVGGIHSIDSQNKPAGGGASFINTSAGCIPIELVPSNNSGAGKATITYEQRSLSIEDPVREGYKFDGWQIDGKGTCTYNKLGNVTMFNFVTGTSTTLKAKWIKL